MKFPRKYIHYLEDKLDIYLVALWVERPRKAEIPNLPILLRKNHFFLEHLGLLLPPVMYKNLTNDNKILSL